MNTKREWQRCNSETFWQEVAICSHVVQLYENDETLLNLLEDFIAGGISVGDCVIIIATEEHLLALEQRLILQGLDVGVLKATNQYLPLNAEEALSEFMLHDMPDAQKFVETMTQVFDRVRDSKRQVRAFGEIVSLLWARGNSAATFKLEQLWNAFFEKESFSLFCAYPNNKFSEDAATLLSNICRAHSKIITNEGTERFDLAYSSVI